MPSLKCNATAGICKQVFGEAKQDSAAPARLKEPLKCSGFLMNFQRTVYARKSLNRSRLWTAAVFFALSITRTLAGDIRVDEKQDPPSVTIHIAGKFLQQDFNQLDAMLEQIERRRGLAAVTVTLDSPGGAHFEGLRLGLLLQRKGIGTRIMPGATCFSACASIFFGGFNRKTGKPNRVAHEGSRLGVHRMTHDSGIWSAEIERRVGAAAQVYFADMRLSEKVRRMFTETPPHDIYILTPSDMAESDITFVPSSGADSRPRKQPTAAPRVSTSASAS